MKLSDYDFDLPRHLIAQYPPEQRGDSRLLLVPGEGDLVDASIRDFPNQLGDNDLVVFNDTRVIPARCIGKKLPDGGRIEIFLERILDDHRALVQIGTNKKVRDGLEFTIGSRVGRVCSRESGFFIISIPGAQILEVFHEHGEMPLPPYIERMAADADQERYQTIYARQPGAVAAPTAGLHFDENLMAVIRNTGANIGMLTLHVGAGTFQPIRTDDISQHKMHSERYSVSDVLSTDIEKTRSAGGRVVAVGTTVARTLESVADPEGRVTSGVGETSIFIVPGYQFKVVDRLLTNFHLPKSTLMLMVSAFAGNDRIRQAYQHAIEKQYRFFSYGDAMLLDPQ